MVFEVVEENLMGDQVEGHRVVQQTYQDWSVLIECNKKITYDRDNSSLTRLMGPVGWLVQFKEIIEKEIFGELGCDDSLN